MAKKKQTNKLNVNILTPFTNENYKRFTEEMKVTNDADKKTGNLNYDGILQQGLFEFFEALTGKKYETAAQTAATIAQMLENAVVFAKAQEATAKIKNAKNTAKTAKKNNVKKAVK